MTAMPNTEWPIHYIHEGQPTTGYLFPSRLLWIDTFYVCLLRSPNDYASPLCDITHIPPASMELQGRNDPRVAINKHMPTSLRCELIDTGFIHPECVHTPATRYEAPVFRLTDKAVEWFLANEVHPEVAASHFYKAREQTTANTLWMD